LLLKVEHPSVVTTGSETIAFKSSRRFIDISSLSSEREDCKLHWLAKPDFLTSILYSI
jgi:hypothetical protein